jgi:hypothetical protein
MLSHFAVTNPLEHMHQSMFGKEVARRVGYRKKTVRQACKASPLTILTLEAQEDVSFADEIDAFVENNDDTNNCGRQYNY